MFGRDEDVARVVEALETGDAAVVTITGRGGVGKTVLAAEVVRILDRPDRTTWVPLAGVTEPGLVATDIATAAGVPVRPDVDVLAAVAAALGGEGRLLVLDDAEHLLSAAPLVGDLAQRCQDLRILVTSQAPLRLRSEQVIDLDPLPVPAAAGRVGPEELADQPAVALYCHHAAAVDRRFSLSEHNSAAVTELCRRLGGLPLAIELAAARAAVLPPGEILRQLERCGFDVLHRERADAPARHHDLRAAIEWTCDLLTADERRVLRQLAVNAGTFDMEAVLALTSSDPEGPGADAASLDHLSALVDVHLVDPVRQSEPPRFVLPESIRAHARAEAELLGEIEAIDRRRIAMRARQARPVAEGSEVGYSEHRSVGIESDRDDLLDALAAALAYGLADDAMDIARGLAALWDARGYGPPQEQLLDQVVELGERTGADPSRLVNVLLWCSYLGLRHTSRHPREHLVERIRSAEAIALAVGDPACRLHALYVWTLVSPLTGDVERAAAAAEEALRLTEDVGDERWRSVAQVWAGMLAHQLGDGRRAVELGTAALSTGRRCGDDEIVVRSALLLGPLADRFPDAVRDLPSIEDLVVSAHQLGLTLYEVVLRLRSVNESLRSGDLGTAVQRLCRVLELVRTMVGSPIVGFTLLTVASTAHASGDDRRTAFFHGTVRAWLPAFEMYLTEAERERYRVTIEQTEAALGAAGFDAEVGIGEATGWDEAIVVAIGYAEEVSASTGRTTAVVGRPRSASPDAGLTHRQTEVLELLARGLSNKEIAAALGVRAKTVMHHTTAIYRALGVRGRSEATAVAFRSGIVR